MGVAHGIAFFADLEVEGWRGKNCRVEIVSMAIEVARRLRRGINERDPDDGGGMYGWPHGARC